MRTTALILLACTARLAHAQDRWKMLHANELQTPWTTIRVGGAILPEIASYNQDDGSRQQMATLTGDTVAGAVDLRSSPRASVRTATAVREQSTAGELVTAGKIRDSRFVISGRLTTKRPITWQTGLMYDWGPQKWLVRQTAFVISVPEIASNFWIGRTKEGPSLNRVMVGYDGWTMERFTFSDAAIPLLADGVRWQGYLPKLHFVWNLGWFNDFLSEGESFSYFDHQVAGRVGYLKMDSTSSGSLVHIAVGFHHGTPNNHTLQLKSKPEASGAPNFIDTGKIPATAADLVGVEAYYRPASWLFGTEYYVERAKSPSTNNPVFNGGDVFASWLITGETRQYFVPGGHFKDVVPRKSAFEHGPGAVEVLLRLSNIDLNAGTVEGGTFWRITPTLNWYLSENVRLELGYGYGALTRFGTTGATQFFQSRLQLQL